MQIYLWLFKLLFILSIIDIYKDEEEDDNEELILL